MLDSGAHQPREMAQCNIFLRYGWGPPNLKCVTWHNHAPFRDSLYVRMPGTSYDRSGYQIWNLYVDWLGRMQHRPCKKSWTDWHAVWDGERGRPKEPCFRLACTLAPTYKYGWTTVRSSYECIFYYRWQLDMGILCSHLANGRNRRIDLGTAICRYHTA